MYVEQLITLLAVHFKLQTFIAQYFSSIVLNLGHVVAQFVDTLRLKRVRFLMVSLKFFIDIILPTALWPGGLKEVGA